MSDTKNNGSISLGEAATRFLAGLPDDAKASSQQEVNHFVRWYGSERRFAELKAPEVANYAERLSLSDTDYVRKLELVRNFLVYVKKEGWSKPNLATHLKAKKGKSAIATACKLDTKEVFVTQQGYDGLKVELAALKQKRSQVVEEIRRAAADKDFRENAPFHAAREQKGWLEGQIKELEATLKSAAIIGDNHKVTHKSSVGDTVVLCDTTSGEECRYKIVGSREADPSRGKISDTSPLGKAILGRVEQEVVEVIVPVGKMRYQVKKIER